MIRRLAAMAALTATLAACTPPKPEAKAPEAAPAAKTSAAQPGYKAAKSPTLEAVRKRGYVACGVHAGLPGFALKDARGQWRGFVQESARERERRLLRECKGRPNAGACAGYAS